jgi:Mce-associated membrane protein
MTDEVHDGPATQPADDDAAAEGNADGSAEIDTPTTTIEAPPADEPLADEPVADEPLADEAAADQALADEPPADDALADDGLADEPVAEEPVAEEPPGPRRLLRGLKVVPLVLVTLLVISGGAAAWLYFKEYRPDELTKPSVTQAVVAAASDGTVAMLSYSYDTLEKDFAAARTHLTGDFLTKYNQLARDSVAPVAKQNSIKATAHIAGVAVKELHPDWASVLVFADQTTNKVNFAPVTVPSSVQVRMARADGKWLISGFDPIM